MEADSSPVPNIDMHRLIIRRKMTELKERLKSTEKVLNDTLNILDSASMRIADEEADIEEERSEYQEKQAEKLKKAQASAEPGESQRKWSLATIYL